MKIDEDDYDIATFYINVGKCFARSGEHIKAIHCYKKSLKAYPNNSVAYNNLGKCFKKLGISNAANPLY